MAGEQESGNSEQGLKLIYEPGEAVPDNLSSEFEEFEIREEGKEPKKVQMHKSLADAKKSAYRFQGDVTRLSGELETKNTKLASYEERERQNQADKDEKRRKKQEQDGDYKQMYEDLKQRTDKEKEDQQKVINSLQSDITSGKKESILSKIAAMGTPETSSQLRRLASQDFKLNEEGVPVILNDKGEATSQSLDDYMKTLPTKYPNLVAAKKGSGGKGQGSLKGGAGGEPKENAAAEEAKKNRNVQGFIAAKLSKN